MENTRHTNGFSDFKLDRGQALKAAITPSTF